MVEMLVGWLDMVQADVRVARWVELLGNKMADVKVATLVAELAGRLEV